MKRVAKLLLEDNDGRYLLLYRKDHPSFENDPDLPGSTLEASEEPVSGLIREVSEEIGVILDGKLEKVLESDRYDKGHTYYLYKTAYRGDPSITLSWEHSYYEWLSLEDFTYLSHSAVDHYMHMVYDYLSQNRYRPAR